MNSRCNFETRFCSADAFNELKRIYDEYVKNSKSSYCSVLERFDIIAEKIIRPKIINMFTLKIMVKRHLNETQARRSVDQMWRSCKGSLYEYAICKAFNEILMSNSFLAQRLDIIHGSKLDTFTREQLIIKNWNEILPDVDFVIVNKVCNRAVAVLSCKTSLRERLTETAFWAKELKPKGIDVIFITTDKDKEITADVNRYMIMHVLDYTIITDPNRYDEIVLEWRTKYGNKSDFSTKISKILSFKNIIMLLQQYAIKC